MKYVNCNRTRSEPPDINDPYKMDLLEAELTKKYQNIMN